MPLVEYSDSEADDNDDEPEPSAKKRKTSSTAAALPPLPAIFRDLYSSTVRTSTQDDPSLHGGRKRVVPHVQGNWPTHVYLEWCPEEEEYDALARVVEAQQQQRERTAGEDASNAKLARHEVHSLLQNDLGVSLPLHISLSRPLVLRTEQKDAFLQRLKQAVSTSGVSAFDVSPAELRWHPNEDRTRWFLVAQVTQPGEELLRLLQTCNTVAAEYKQPKLYEDDNANKGAADEAGSEGQNDVLAKFHISIAWSLQPPSVGCSSGSDDSSTKLPNDLRTLKVPFVDVKVRIGQDVTAIPLATRRQTLR